MKLVHIAAVVLMLGSAAACSSSDGDDQGAKSYTVVDEQETGLGTEVTVSVEDNTDPEGIFNEVLDDNDEYATVTIVCSGDDVREDGYILFGTREGDNREVVGGEQDRDC